MVDGFSVASIIFRAITIVSLLMVLRKQIRLWGMNDGALKRFKILLMSEVVLLLIANIFAIWVNSHRQADGNLIEDVRHMSQIFNGVSNIGVAVCLYLIYDYHEK